MKREIIAWTIVILLLMGNYLVYLNITGVTIHPFLNYLSYVFYTIDWVIVILFIILVIVELSK